MTAPAGPLAEVYEHAVAGVMAAWDETTGGHLMALYETRPNTTPSYARHQVDFDRAEYEAAARKRLENLHPRRVPLRCGGGAAVSAAVKGEVVRVYSEDDLRDAVRAAYIDASRIVSEPRGSTQVARDRWRLQTVGLVDRIVGRGDGFGVPGGGSLPCERLTASARDLDIPTTLAEAERLGVVRR